MTSSVPGYSLNFSSSQISSWHGSRTDPDSIFQIRYQASKAGPQQSFSAMELRSFYFPNTIPNIVNWSSDGSLQNNDFVFKDLGVGTGEHSILITSKMWDAISLATYLQTEINALALGPTYTVTYDAVAGKYTFTTNSGGNFQIVSRSTTPWLELGFPANTTFGSAASITSPSVSQLQGTGALYLVIPELQGSMNAVYNSSGVTFIIPIITTSTYTTQWSFQTSAPLKWYTSPTEKTIRDFTIRVYFERAGVLYPLIMDAHSSYELNLAYFSLHI